VVLDLEGETPETGSDGTGSDQTGGTMLILGIDPGPKHSGVVLFDADAFKVEKAYCEPNEDILCDLRQWQGVTLAIETMAAMGMAVAQDTFTTQLWAGRFVEAVDCRGGSVRDLKRQDVKLHLCGLARAKDPNVRRAVMDKFEATGGGEEPRKGTKSQPGPLYGVSGNDVWSALAIAVTAAETGNDAAGIVMPFSPDDFLSVRDEQQEIIESANRRVAEAWEQAATCPLPENLRPATSDDVVVGAVIWKPDFDGDCKWCVIDEVQCPDDDFKAWVSDGCRYGLHRAFVEA
jgi:hypothetical protein